MKKKITLSIVVLCFFLVGLSAVSYRSHRKLCENWVMTQHPDASGAQGMFYTFKNYGTGTLIVVDSGNKGNAEYAKSVITELGGHVDCWILTHFHGDHAGAFDLIYEDPGDITIGTIYATPLDYDYFYSVARWWDAPEVYAQFLKMTADADNVTYLQRGDSFAVDDLTIDVFSAYDDFVHDLQQDPANNGSLIFKISGIKDSILFFGDAYNETLFDDIYAAYGDQMKAEYVQAPHHGNSVLPMDKYTLLEPEVIFLDGPEWLMISEDHKAKDLLVWCQENGVTSYDYRTAPNVFNFK